MSGGLWNHRVALAYRKVKGKQILDKSGPLLKVKRNTTHQNKGTIRVPCQCISRRTRFTL